MAVKMAIFFSEYPLFCVKNSVIQQVFMFLYPSRIPWEFVRVEFFTWRQNFLAMRLIRDGFGEREEGKTGGQAGRRGNGG